MMCGVNARISNFLIVKLIADPFHKGLYFRCHFCPALIARYLRIIGFRMPFYVFV